MFLVVDLHNGWRYATILPDPNSNSNRVFEDVNDAADEAGKLENAIVVGEEMIEIEDEDASKMEELTDAENKLIELQAILSNKPTTNQVLEASAIVEDIAVQLRKLQNKIIWK